MGPPMSWFFCILDKINLFYFVLDDAFQSNVHTFQTQYMRSFNVKNRGF